MANIHPTAIIAKGACLAEDVSIGPYSVIGPHVSIGAKTVIDHHTFLTGRTSIGAGNHVFPFASIGTVPQDLKYEGEDTSLVIGDNNIIREFVTLNIGTRGGGGVTRIGNDNLLMAYVHVAHDCQIHNHVIMANCATLAGHIEVEDHTIIGGLSAVHQFVRIGRHAMIGGASAVAMDVPPFMNATGNRAQLHGINLVGLRRHGFDSQRIRALKAAYRIIFRSGLTVVEALRQVKKELLNSTDVDYLVEFINASKRGITR